jgi:hypothetical protein
MMFENSSRIHAWLNGSAFHWLMKFQLPGQPFDLYDMGLSKWIEHIMYLFIHVYTFYLCIWFSLTMESYIVGLYYVGPYKGGHCHSAMHVYENYFQTSLKLLITITEVEHIEH